MTNSTINEQSGLPLTSLQQGMLFHAAANPGAGLYLQQLVGWLHEDIDPARLYLAWEAATRRHDILRTTFSWHTSMRASQHVHERFVIPFNWKDDQEILATNRLDAYLAEDRKRGFDVTGSPPWRITLFQVHPELWIFVWTFHHALLDGRSHAMLLEETFDHYDALVSGRSYTPPTRRPFSTFLKWLARHDHQASAPFWREQLSDLGTTTRLDLAVENREHDHAPDSSVHSELRLPSDLTDRLEDTARSAGVTLNNLVQAAWSLLLARHTGHETVAFGVTRAGRHYDGFHAKHDLGLFINTVPLCVTVKPDTPVHPWLSSFRDRQIAIRPHEHTPLETIAGWVDRPAAELVDSVLIFEDHELDDRLHRKGPAWQKRIFSLHERTGHLTLAAYAGTRLRLHLEAPTQRMLPARAEQILSRLEHVLKVFANGLAVTVSDIDILPEVERQLLLGPWSGRRIPYPDQTTLPRIFEEQARSTPNSPALISGNLHLTYAELDQQANQLAHHLLAQGLEKGDPVGVCLDRCPKLAIAFLAVLKAGGVYVPIDPAYPRDRLAFYLRDSSTKLLLTESAYLSNLPDHPAPRLVLDGPNDPIRKHPVHPPNVNVDPDAVAYILFTSGSTGTPKGALNEHRGLCNLIGAIRHVFGLSTRDRVVQFSAPSFDVSLYDMLLAWSSGATLVFGAWDELLPGPDLIRFLEDQRITVATFTPTVLKALPDAPLSHLQTLICCGEACPVEIVDRWAPGRRFFNAYGPTETTIWSTYDECAAGSARPSIGRPIDNMNVYVLDGDVKPVPIGLPGELYLGGVGVGCGYLNRPELTAERFLPDPFQKKSGARLYRTGDLVRFLPDGRLDFLERMDNQVKIKGVRIELGEIESYVRQHPAVNDAVVKLDGERIHAFCTSATDTRPDRTALRQHLSEHLPHFLIPEEFWFVEEMPRTRSGKIDRNALQSGIAHLGDREGRSENAGRAPQPASRWVVTPPSSGPTTAHTEAPRQPPNQPGRDRDTPGYARAPSPPAQIDTAEPAGSSEVIPPAAGIRNPLPPEDRRRVLETWNRTGAPFPSDQMVHTLVSAQVARTPEATALGSSHGTLTYGQLESRANELAAQLLSRGLEPQESVAVFMERSLEATIACLGILKAGGAFVPLDPAQPRNRSLFILEDARARCVVTTPGHRPDLPSRLLESIEVDLSSDPGSGPAGQTTCASSPNPSPPTDDPTRRAYVIYTSGSTGHPKGVEVEHRSLVNLMTFYARRLRLGPADRSSMAANPAFDASLADIWPYLAVGASVHVPPTSTLLDPSLLVAWLVEHHITVSFLPPALVGLLLDRSWPPKTSLRYLLTGGDVLRQRPRHPLPFTLINTYGPTENTVDSTWAVIEPGDPEDKPPIGRPIDNVTAYVLDSQGHPVAVGTPGELNLGGIGVARGYVNRPEMTRERFVPDPFDATPGARLYRTGDLVRYRPTGELEFLGRMDDQIQIRGFRVELGEIEAVLVNHPSVRAAAVRPIQCRPDHTTDPVVRGLAAYVETRDTGNEFEESLRRHLLEQLPSYMVPSSITCLEALPRTAGGKVDRQALPDPASTRSIRTTGKEPPGDNIECRLLQIWEDVLETSPIGIQDNFFDLGGHSLLILHLLARIEKTFGVKLPLAALLQNPTIRKLARLLDPDREEAPDATCLADIRTEGARPPLLCVAGAGGGLQRFLGFSRRLDSDQPVHCLLPMGLPPEVRDTGTIEAMAEHFVREIERRFPDGPCNLGGYSSGGFIAYEIARQLRDRGRSVPLLFLMDTFGPGTRVQGKQRALRYLKNFLALSIREKLIFFRDKIRWIGILIRNHWRVMHTRAEAEELQDAKQLEIQAALAYRPKPWDGPLVLIRSQNAPRSAPREPEAGWKELARGGLTVHFIPGDHYTMFEPPGDRVIAETLQTYLQTGSALTSPRTRQSPEPAAQVDSSGPRRRV